MAGEHSMYDNHTLPHSTLTVSQRALWASWMVAAAVYGIRYLIGKESTNPRNNDVENNVPVTNGGENKSQTADGNEKKVAAGPPVPTVDEFLKNATLFGGLLFVFFLCDYIKVFPNIERAYTRDTFLFLIFILVLLASGVGTRSTKDVILNRDQTEEWKGWMQVLFVWYHYYAAKEWYNWIRVYIAAYVWMTGFGNFSFFWVREDFSLWRVTKMLFRLNFLVIFVCISTSNEYMLYYICAMHTYWFISVYIFMWAMKSWNKHRGKMAIKFAIYAIANAIIFEIPGCAETVFRPLWFILGYHEPKHGLMHEWAFRAGLDHWACFVGMLSAYNYPYFEAFMKYSESNEISSRKRIFLKTIMITAAVLSLITWYTSIMTRDKFAYNALHPYTSAIPIISYIILRNSFPVLRTNFLFMFNWLGKITLETYLSQLHIYLQSNAKHLIGLIVGYPLLNFSLVTIIYLLISFNCFKITNVVSSYLLPKETRTLLRNCGVTIAVIGGMYAVCYVLYVFL